MENNNNDYSMLNTDVKDLVGTSGVKDSKSKSGNFFDKDKDGDVVLTQEFKECLDLMENTGDHLFITGDAGVGKSTLIKYFIKNTSKNVAVVAPTGVAALNIGGQTIHSLFQLPPRIIQYEDIKVITNPKKKRMYDRIDTIIIDEISMVSSNLMQSINDFLHVNVENSGEAFSGKQIIMVGDLMQLPPVISNQAIRDMVNDKYGGKWFFDATVWKNTMYHKIKLTKNFRQNDEHFINLLNKVKYGEIEQADLDTINERFVGRVMKTDAPVLCTLNKMVDNINDVMLRRIDGEYTTLVGSIEGDFRMNSCNVDETIKLKVGAKVMILSNDSDGKRWVNGTFGEFIGIKKYDDETFVLVKSGDSIHEVYEVSYEQYKYDYDRAKGTLTSNVVGTFTQFPIRVAFGVSIHKSQGCTLDKAHIDFGDNPAFDHGQVYVALSRCRTFEGITLARKLERGDIKIEPKINFFMKQFRTFGENK